MSRFKDKKVLVLNLGLLGKGATVKWFLNQGSDVTVTDAASPEVMAPSMESVEAHMKDKGISASKLHWRIGEPSLSLVDDCEVLVINPSVPINDSYVKRAFELNKEITNEAIIFFENFGHPIIGITGTRGKTTTVAWTSYFLSSIFRSSIAGNSLTHPFLAVLEQKDDLDIAVAEVPSFQLELVHYSSHLPTAKHVAPYIAVITNISQDHLNRHGTMEEYTKVKSSWLNHQNETQYCVLNADDEWVYFLISQAVCPKPWYFSSKELREGLNGIWHEKDAVYFRDAQGKKQKVLTLDDDALSLGEHNISNLMTAAISAYLAGVPWENIQEKIANLPKVPLRQEIVYSADKLTIINDTTATSPEGAIQALKRFGSSETVLITGGTDRQLDFSKWAGELKQNIQPSNVIFLAGSATDKMLALLDDWSAAAPVCDTLEECFQTAIKKSSQYPKAVILFSPASKSFEKFKNEFDRGQQFNDLVSKFNKGLS